MPARKSIPNWVYALAKQWEKDRNEYPVGDPRAEVARTAVKLCQQELLQAAANATTHDR